MGFEIKLCKNQQANIILHGPSSTSVISPSVRLSVCAFLSPSLSSSLSLHTLDHIRLWRLQRHCNCCAGKDGNVEPRVSSWKHSNSHVYGRTWEDRETLAFKNNACRFSRVFFSPNFVRWVDWWSSTRGHLTPIWLQVREKSKIFFEPLLHVDDMQEPMVWIWRFQLTFFGLK